jgi:catalase
MVGVNEAIQRRQLEHFRRADPAYTDGVTKALGLK